MKSYFLILCIFCTVQQTVSAQIISTFAGTPFGDGNLATYADLNLPLGVAVDKRGNIYIADTYNEVVRKINSSGVISTFAGTTGTSYGGTMATSTSLAYPCGLAIDRFNNVYIADAQNHRICKVDSNGVLSFIAGNGLVGFGGDGGPATAANLCYPNGVAVDSLGNIFIADTYNQRIRKVNNSGIISTVAGNGFGAGTTGIGGFSGDGGPATNAELNLPNNIALDLLGNVYIADQHNSRIRKVSVDGNITTLAGTDSAGYSGDGGLATNAKLNNPYGLIIDKHGNLIFSDTYNERIRKIDSNGFITTVVGNGTIGFSGDGGFALAAQLHAPAGVVMDGNNNLFFGDLYNNRVRKIDTNFMISTIAGGVPLSLIDLSTPSGVAVDADGIVYVADEGHQTVKKINNQGIVTIIGGTGAMGFSGDGGPATAAKFSEPYYLAVDRKHNVYVTDYQNNCIRKIDSNGMIHLFAGNTNFGYSGDGGPATNAELNYPFGITTDSIGNVFFSDQGNYRICKVDTNGTICTFAGNGISGYSGDGGAATNAQFSLPLGIFADDSGNIYIADVNNDRIRKVNASGTISTVVGGIYSTGLGATTSVLNKPTGVAIDRMGNIFILQTDGNEILKLSATDSLSIFAGNGIEGFSGDGGPATNAEFYVPFNLAVDNCDNVYIADYFNNRIRKVNGLTGRREICIGATTTLHDPLGGGTWSSRNGLIATINPSSGVVTGISAGTDTITYSIGSVISEETVTIDTPISAGVITGIHSLCVGNSHTLSDIVTGGTWSSSSSVAAVSDSGVVTGLSVGSATIDYTVANLCGSATALFPIEVVPPTVCAPLAVPIVTTSSEEMSIYPNPNSGNFKLFIRSQNTSDALLSITDMLGETRYERRISTNNEIVIDLDLSIGVYFVAAVTSKGRYLSKIVVVRP